MNKPIIKNGKIMFGFFSAVFLSALSIVFASKEIFIWPLFIIASFVVLFVTANKADKIQSEQEKLKNNPSSKE